MNNICVIIAYGGQYEDSWEHPVRYALTKVEAQTWISKQVLIDAKHNDIALKLANHYNEWISSQPDIKYPECYTYRQWDHFNRTSGDIDLVGNYDAMEAHNANQHAVYDQAHADFEALWQKEFDNYCISNDIPITEELQQNNKGDDYPEECWYKITEISSI